MMESQRMTESAKSPVLPVVEEENEDLSDTESIHSSMTAVRGSSPILAGGGISDDESGEVMFDKLSEPGYEQDMQKLAAHSTPFSPIQHSSGPPRSLSPENINRGSLNRGPSDIDESVRHRPAVGIKTNPWAFPPTTPTLAQNLEGAQAHQLHASVDNLAKTVLEKQATIDSLHRMVNDVNRKLAGCQSDQLRLTSLNETMVDKITELQSEMSEVADSQAKVEGDLRRVKHETESQFDKNGEWLQSLEKRLQAGHTRNEYYRVDVGKQIKSIEAQLQGVSKGSSQYTRLSYPE